VDRGRRPPLLGPTVEEGFETDIVGAVFVGNMGGELLLGIVIKVCGLSNTATPEPADPSDA
jgi:hypothetical protein